MDGMGGVHPLYNQRQLMCLFESQHQIWSADSIPIWWRWGYWLSPLTYAWNAICVNEFSAPRWQTIYYLGNTLEEVSQSACFCLNTQTCRHRHMDVWAEAPSRPPTMRHVSDSCTRPRIFTSLQASDWSYYCIQHHSCCSQKCPCCSCGSFPATFFLQGRSYVASSDKGMPIDTH